MEVNEANMGQLAVYLQQTLSPQAEVGISKRFRLSLMLKLNVFSMPNQVRKPAEDFLTSVETNQNYPVLLLSLLNSEAGELNIKVAGAITFKNYIKRNWKVSEEGPDRIHASDRDQVDPIYHRALIAPTSILLGEDLDRGPHVEVAWSCPEATKPGHCHHRAAGLPHELAEPRHRPGRQVCHRRLSRDQRGSPDRSLHL